MSDPWFKFYASDWLAGTMMLTAAERGIYISLIAAMYDAGGPIPNEPRRLARLTGASNSALKKAVQTLLEDGKLELDERGYLFNSRVKSELRHRSLRSEKARVAGEISQQKQRASSDLVQQEASHTRSQKPEPEYTTLNAREVSDALFEAVGGAMADPARSPGVMVMSEPLSWLRSGADPDLDILPTLRAKAANRPPGSIGSWAYFTAAVMEAKARRERAHETPEITDEPTTRPAKFSGSAERGRAASEQRKSAWLDAVEELDGGAGSGERPERQSGDYGSGRRVASLTGTG